MVGLTKVVQIGVIAEEKNDVEVIYELTCKIIKEKNFAFKNFVGHGCGKVRRKCEAWGRALLARGCSHIVILHDLDKGDEKKLRAELEAQIRELNFEQKVVLISVEELEAWLLSDPDALKSVFNMQKSPRVRQTPEKISDPKEFLGNIIRKYSKSEYLNTIHNRRIAKALSIANLTRCPSFSPYPKFLKTIFPKTTSRVT